EDGGEQSCLLEAIASAPVHDQLLLERPEIQTYGTAEQDVEILERNAHHVCQQEPRQRIERGAKAAGPSDAVEVGVEIERRHSRRLTSRSRSAGSLSSHVANRSYARH